MNDLADLCDNGNLLKVLEEVNDGIYITDGKADTLFLNKAYERISGSKRSMFLNKNMEQVVKEHLIDDSASLRVVNEKREVTMNQILHNGKKVLITASPIYNEKNEIELIVTILRDVTTLNEIQEDLELKNKRLNNLMTILEKEGGVVYRSEFMDNVVNRALKASQYNTTILIMGETGVGKDILAKLIHKSGIRKNEKFIELNCSAIPASLIESELFGYEKGSFTGASKEGKKGLFELANQGTIFLDEIGDLPLELQTKLLKVIQDKRLYRIGGEKEIDVDVNIVSATNRDLLKMVREKKFREDLYYRLNVIPIFIPPLRERKEDIFVLIEYFLHKLINTYKEEKVFSEEVMRILYNYDWPGNVRELKNIVERTYILSKSKIIRKDDLPKEIMTDKRNKEFLDYEGLNLHESMEKFEMEFIKNVIEKTKNNKEAAEILKIDQSTLTRKRRKYSI